MKPLTPYQRLLVATRRYVSQIMGPETHVLWRIAKADVDKDIHCSCRDLRISVETADALGYDVHVSHADGVLLFRYVKRPTDIDYPLFN